VFTQQLVEGVGLKVGIFEQGHLHRRYQDGSKDEDECVDVDE
jgi:hypothetical protein